MPKLTNTSRFELSARLSLGVITQCVARKRTLHPAAQSWGGRVSGPQIERSL